jgi:hypothetical protein
VCVRVRVSVCVCVCVCVCVWCDVGVCAWGFGMQCVSVRAEQRRQDTGPRSARAERAGNGAEPQGTTGSAGLREPRGSARRQPRARLEAAAALWQVRVAVDPVKAVHVDRRAAAPLGAAALGAHRKAQLLRACGGGGAAGWARRGRRTLAACPGGRGWATPGGNMPPLLTLSPPHTRTIFPPATQPFRLPPHPGLCSPLAPPSPAPPRLRHVEAVLGGARLEEGAVEEVAVVGHHDGGARLYWGEGGGRGSNE